MSYINCISIKCENSKAKYNKLAKSSLFCFFGWKTLDINELSLFAIKKKCEKKTFSRFFLVFWRKFLLNSSMNEHVKWDVPAVLCGNEIPRYLEPQHDKNFTRYIPALKCIRCQMENYLTFPSQNPVFCEDCYQEMSSCKDPSHDCNKFPKIACLDCLKIWRSIPRHCIIINLHENPRK